MAFESLSDRLSKAFKNISGQGKLTEKNMNEYSLDFFMNLLFKPNVQDNKFDQTSFNVVTNVLRKSINSIKDNKTKYSIIKVLEVMNHNE